MQTAEETWNAQIGGWWTVNVQISLRIGHFHRQRPDSEPLGRLGLLRYICFILILFVAKLGGVEVTGKPNDKFANRLLEALNKRWSLLVAILRYRINLFQGVLGLVHWCCYFALWCF